MKELVVELSRNCNLSCIMCGFGGHKIKPEWFMPWDVLERVLAELGATLEIIRLNGRGESTIHPDFAELVELTRTHCPQAAIHLFTNLSWNQSHLLELFAEVGIQLFISIDSPDADLMKEIRRGCRPDWIEQNLRALQHMEPRPFIVATLQEKNLYQIVDLAEYALRHRCHLLFNTVRYDDGAPELEVLVRDSQDEISRLFAQAVSILKEAGLRCHCPDQMHGVPLGGSLNDSTAGSGGRCPALTHELFITYNGKVQPCNMFHPYVLGDLRRQCVEQIKNHSRWKWFADHHCESDYCSNCAYLKAEV